MSILCYLLTYLNTLVVLFFFFLYNQGSWGLKMLNKLLQVVLHNIVEGNYAHNLICLLCWSKKCSTLMFLKLFLTVCGMHRLVECQAERNKENRPCQVSGYRSFRAIEVHGTWLLWNESSLHILQYSRYNWQFFFY